MTQKLKQWGTSDGSLQIILLFNSQIQRCVLSLPVVPLFLYLEHCISAEILSGIASPYRAAKNEWETKQTERV